MDVRPSTRAVFEELRAQGNVPSVRTMYAKLKGSYPLLAHELQALREEAAAGLPPLPAAPAPVLHAVTLGMQDVEAARVPLLVSQAAMEAMGALLDELRADRAFYERVHLALARLQPRREGVLTALLAALVGKEA